MGLLGIDLTESTDVLTLKRKCQARGPCDPFIASCSASLWCLGVSTFLGFMGLRQKLQRPLLMFACAWCVGSHMKSRL
ncbi:hypothetical protein E2C01_068677 [Portunus trituberculatus]|uniref:Uncharacterized protein n=1 Tax=Portunus trituberculatus TaxID=210409 RepID=A0A5B7HPF3_PORTR|nr:hypothetical protein [Portunus trituberculatus]